jgi:hypothetical protein
MQRITGPAALRAALSALAGHFEETMPAVSPNQLLVNLDLRVQFMLPNLVLD